MSKRKAEKIKPCPFCGSLVVDVARTNERSCWVECSVCAAHTTSASTRNMAIYHWNKRAGMPECYAVIHWDQDKESRERSSGS